MGQSLTKEYPSTWEEDEVQKWKQTAKSFQKNFYLAFEGKQFDAYKRNEYDLLRVKICYAVYGPPTDNNDNIDDITQAYNKDQKEFASKIKDKILEVYKEYARLSELQVGILFIHCKEGEKQFATPLFRVGVSESIRDNYYVDVSCRTYKSWDDWKDNNKLPMLKYCYPKYGFYSCSNRIEYKFDPESNPILEFGTSPACDFSARVGNVFDFGTGAVGFISAGVGIASMFTPIGPIVLLTSGIAGTSSAVYGAGRSVNRLIDKGTHDESLKDLESIMCSLTVMMVPLHIGTSAVNGVLAAGARNGRIFSDLQRFGATVLNISTFVVDSSVFVTGIINLVYKAKEGNLDGLDVLQFAVSVFFFTHTLVQPKTAGRIIKQAQNNYFSEISKNMSDETASKTFNKFVEDNNDSMRSGARIVKTINNIKDANSFFKSVGEENASLKLGGRSGKTIIINNQLRINPNRFNQLEPGMARKVLIQTAPYRDTSTNITEQTDEFKTFSKTLRQQERLGFETRYQENLESVAAALGTEKNNLKDFKVNGKLLFNDLNGSDLERLNTVFSELGKKYKKDVIIAALDASRHFEVNNVDDFCSVVELITNMGKTSKEGISTFIKNINTNETARKKVVDDITKHCIDAKSKLKNTEFKFDNPLTAAYHFLKHGHEFGDNVTMDIYFNDIPKDLFQEKYLFKDVYDPNGNARWKTYANPNGNKFGVLRTENGQTYIATVFSNESFFKNWTEKLAAARENLAYTSRQFDLPFTPETTFFDMFKIHLLVDMGFALTKVRVHKNNIVEDFAEFHGNKEKIEEFAKFASAF